MKVLLLASYCGTDGDGCTDDLPCLDCLKMCNIVTVRGPPTENLGGWDYNRQLAATGLPREQAIEKLRDEVIKWIAAKVRKP